ncbi:hypothetical protein [Roseiconus lacunae]|uniref:hypothetical protein n=1 Tax=Roseiconus lacunae TaxID=2605694 RepID=UPI001E5F5345|nr:hypothetical protein [Roseiconus lacunae]
MQRNAIHTLADMLPVQSHYVLLSDGERFARFGHGGINGLLVFEQMQKASEFCETVGSGLPEFKPVVVEAEFFLTLIEEIGAVCVVDGLRVGVGIIPNC